MVFFDLGGNWRVAQAGTEETFPAQVPGCIHNDLLAAGRIDDPFYRDNEVGVQWVGAVDWVYTRTFTAGAELLAHDAVRLSALGLDTLATLTLNGIEVGRTDNMFRSWEFDVKSLLLPGENTLKIRFAATYAYVAEREQIRHMHSWHPPVEILGRGWIRKAQCSYGWDWGVRVPSCGIWRPIRLLAFDTARLADVSITQDHTTPGVVGLEVTARAETVRAGALTAEVRVSFNGMPVSAATATLQEAAATFALSIAEPRLWWPNDMGAQPLYDVEVTLRDSEGRVCDTVTKRIGLRTLRLDRHPDQWGETFQFVVNGIPFFAKGANWIPADAFLPRITRADYARLLGDAANAHMNMIRAWGGGIYEDDAFYELCDELGLCVWQDCMFACSTYPAFDEAFMANVREEIAENIARLRHHACIALWCGNNELEQGLVGPEWNATQMSWEDYAKLFDDMIPGLVQQLDPQRDYWPCSPHSPLGDRTSFNNPTCGDAHLWKVWHAKEPFEWYRTCAHRFNSEFGFQSFPEPKTVNGYTAPQDRNVTTYVMEHHQRSGIGNTTIMQYMLDWFRLPPSFDMTLWLSQILQGMAMKYAVEHWRRSMPRGMGTIYWQLNDCWPVASWSSIDYHGRWKALQYMAKNFYAPLLISGVEDIEAGTVALHVTSDLLVPQQATVRWILTDVAGKTLTEGVEEIEAPARANLPVTLLEFQPFLASHGQRELMLWLELLVDGAVVSTNFVSFARPKHLELADPAITRTVRAADDGTYRVTLQAEHPALWVWIGLTQADACYSTNFVHLRPGMPVTVAIQPAQPMCQDDIEAQLCIHSLVDTYAAPAMALIGE